MAISKSELSSFQDKLWLERYKRSITQSELASAIGISQGHLSYIESGQRDLTLRRYVQIKDYFDSHDEDWGVSNE